MGEWLVADLSILDVHFQAWMLLVTGFFLLLQSRKRRCSLQRDDWKVRGIIMAWPPARC